MSEFLKKKELFLKQKETLDTFLKTGAITQMLDAPIDVLDHF